MGMTIRPILTVPNPILKQVSKPVDKVTDETRTLMDDMLETMYAAPGIGDVQPYEEGCLSVPDVFDTVERPERVKLTYLDYNGERVTEICEGLYATCIQHEMDHLKGIVFIDYLSRLKRDRAVKKVAKSERLKAAG